MPSLDQISVTRREYVLTTGRKLLYTLLALVFLIGAGFFFKLAIDPIGREFALVVGIIFFAPGTMFLLQAWRSRLILEGDAIELHSALCVHSARRDEIEGLRTVENQYGRWTRVYLKHNRGAFNVSNSFIGEGDPNEWFKGLPDLDQRDAAEITEEVNSQSSPGLPVADHSNRFDLAKKGAIGLSILAGAVSIPVMFVNFAPVYRAALVLLLACPPAGMILLNRFPLLFTVFRRDPDPRADLGFLIMWPGVGVMISYQMANDPSHIVDALQLFYWVLLIFALFIAGLFQTVRKSPSRGAVVFFVALLGGMYSVGLANAGNALPDNSPPHPYETQVVSMSESKSSKGTKYYLRVAPWGPITYKDDVDVTRSTYNTFRVGDPVCFGLHPGFLRVRWYTVISCPVQKARTIP